MSYNFTFDLSKLSQALFKEIAELSEKTKVNEKIGNITKKMVKKFNVDKITGLPVSDSLTIVEDLIDIQMQNSLFKEPFQQTDKRALFLPHCCRKYMDSRCKANFNHEKSSYICNHCSEDCQINLATKLAKKENYDLYVVPGASCIRKIFHKNEYEGIVGVACIDELKLSINLLKEIDIPAQSVPLIKNGCVETQFNFETLETVMSSRT